MILVDSINNQQLISLISWCIKMKKVEDIFELKDVLDTLPGMTRFDVYYIEDKGFIPRRKRKVGRREMRYYTREDLEKIQIYWRFHEKGEHPKAAFDKVKEEIDRRIGMQASFDEAVRNYGFLRNEVVKDVKLFEDRRVDRSEFDVEIIEGELRQLTHRLFRLSYESPIEDFKLLQGEKMKPTPEDVSVKIEVGHVDSDVVLWYVNFDPPLKKDQLARYFWEMECQGLRDLRLAEQDEPDKNTRKNVFAGGGRKGLNFTHPTRKFSFTLAFDGGGVDAAYDVFVGRSNKRNEAEYLRLSQKNCFTVVKEGEIFRLDVDFPEIGSNYCITW